jgi:hypothetical protein
MKEIIVPNLRNFYRGLPGSRVIVARPTSIPSITAITGPRYAIPGTRHAILGARYVRDRTKFWTWNFYGRIVEKLCAIQGAGPS